MPLCDAVTASSRSVAAATGLGIDSALGQCGRERASGRSMSLDCLEQVEHRPERHLAAPGHGDDRRHVA
jgi:hypothetical protein